MQLKAFKAGFTKVLETNILELFHPKELMEMIVGSENYDWEVFKENAEYKGEYSKNHTAIIAFWGAFFELDYEQKKQFLKFISGSDRIPLSGMKDVKVIGGYANCLLAKFLRLSFSLYPKIFCQWRIHALIFSICRILRTRPNYIDAF